MRRGLAALLAASLLTGCGGGSSPASTQLRTQATHICKGVNRRLELITPTDGRYVNFLQDGIAVLQPELSRLEAVHASGDDRSAYAGALAALTQEISALKSTRVKLAHHQDPVLAFAALQRRLRPLEAQANDAWRALQIPACVSR